MMLKKIRTKCRYYLTKVQAGFPSPGEDYEEDPLDLNSLMVKNRPATFFARADGDAMQAAGISDGDLLVVDRSLTPSHNRIVVAVVNDEFLCRRYLQQNGHIYLSADGRPKDSIELTEALDATVWGVVTYVVHKTL